MSTFEAKLHELHEHAFQSIERAEAPGVRSFYKGYLSATEAVRKILTAQRDQWQNFAEEQFGTQDLESIEYELNTMRYSITIDKYGMWGSQTLAMLFAELGIQPGDDLAAAVNRVKGAQND